MKIVKIFLFLRYRFKLIVTSYLSTVTTQDQIIDLSSVSCIPSHSCYMSSLAHDDTVTVQSFEDHLGFPLNAFDDIKLEDVIIAWCSQSGES